jgi:hypothetical protein
VIEASMTALRDEVGRFFDDFVTAFCSFSGVSIAALYHVPGVALRGDGSIQCLQSRADIERFFQTAVAPIARMDAGAFASRTWTWCPLVGAARSER